MTGPTPSFFEPGRTYARADDPTAVPQVFRCDQVSYHPVTDEPHAHGFIAQADGGAAWRHTSLTAFAWDRGWEDITPEQDDAAAPEPEALDQDAAFAGIVGQFQETEVPIWPGELVMYHGEQVQYRALYFAEVCRSEEEGRDQDTVRYVLCAQDGTPVLGNVSREAITPARIA
ncbi:hypothetical protein ACIQF6_35815 [Kitasatospora sp. NPDC092948]|uniref:hypothetical protein n=1 Tax=Kitasatospora sp. NPDC092948 TaxID=3364088 RepID=UPI0037FFD2B3